MTREQFIDFMVRNGKSAAEAEAMAQQIDRLAPETGSSK